MQELLVPVQVRFRLKLALALVTSEPLHGFPGGVLEPYMIIQTLLPLRPELATEAAEPFRFFVGFVQDHVTFQAVFPFCFVRALFTMKPRRLFFRRVLDPLVLPQSAPLPCLEVALVAFQPFDVFFWFSFRMTQFCVSVQVVFGFGLEVTLVTSKPVHSFGCGVYQVHVTSQVFFLQSSVLTIKAVKPVCFFVGFVHSHYVTFKRGFQFCFVRALFAPQPQHFFVWRVFDQFVILHSVPLFHFEVAFVALQPSAAVLFDLYVRMAQFYVFVQVIFGFALVQTLVTSNPLHKFG
jgi:hypothetical protein